LSTNHEGEKTAANNEIFLWALYLLGGIDRKVDVEDIYLKAFELAPLRLGWRTRPDIPNFKKAHHALSDVENRAGIGFLIKLGANYRQLSPQGAAWIEENHTKMEELFSGDTKVAAAQKSDTSRLARKLQQSAAWKLWSNNEDVPIAHLASALECSTFSSQEVWAARIASLTAAGKSTNNDEILDFAAFVNDLILKQGEQNV
jgi:hypothetical protein